MEGFIVFDYVKQYPEARKELAQWLAEGKIKRKETIIKGGLAKAEQALVDLYNGLNMGVDQRLVAQYSSSICSLIPRQIVSRGIAWPWTGAGEALEIAVRRWTTTIRRKGDEIDEIKCTKLILQPQNPWCFQRDLKPC